MPTLVKATLVMSDHHLGEGKPRLEDFPRENELAYLEMLEAHLAQMGPGVAYQHVLGGDWLDFHVVEFEGRYGVVPTEEAACAKTQAILDAHAPFFAELRAILARHRQVTLVVVPGNHDLDLEWTSVQAMIRAALVPPEEGERVTFRREVRMGDSALFCHGDAFDPFSANPPETETFKDDIVISRRVVFLMLIISLALSFILSGITFTLVPYTFAGIAVGGIVSFVALVLAFRWIAGHWAFRWGRTQHTLNVPIASYMNAGLGTRLKKWVFHGIGRRVDHGDEWILGLARKSYLVFLLLPMIALEAITLKFLYVFRRPREKFSLGVMLDLFASTMHPDRIEHELNKFLADRPDIAYVIAGHTHDGKMMTVKIKERRAIGTEGRTAPEPENGEAEQRTVIYYNCGTAIRQVRTYKPDVPVVTKWPRVETFFRRVLYHWMHAPLRASLSTVLYAIVPVILFIAPPIPFVTALRWPVSLVCLFLLLWWQFAAEYKDGLFFRFTPVEVLAYDDGSARVRILHYDHEERRFRELTGEDASWDSF